GFPDTFAAIDRAARKGKPALATIPATPPPGRQARIQEREGAERGENERPEAQISSGLPERGRPSAASARAKRRLRCRSHCRRPTRRCSLAAKRWLQLCARSCRAKA